MPVSYEGIIILVFSPCHRENSLLKGVAIAPAFLIVLVDNHIVF